MSSGTIKITVNSASITTSSSSFFLEINACNQSFVTSIVRNEKWHQFEETFEVEYDSDLHESGGSVAVKTKGSKTPLATFPIQSLLTTTPSTFTSSTCSCSLSYTYSHTLGHDPSTSNPLFPLLYISLGLLWLIPQYYYIPYYINLLLLSTTLIYVGSHLSLILRDTETIINADGETMQNAPMGEIMSQADAQKFPFIGSAALFSLFCAFKFLDPEWVNFVISFYFTAAGALAVGQTVHPIIAPVVERYVKWSYKKKIEFSWESKVVTMVIGESPFKETLEISITGILSTVISLFVGYQYFTTKHWTLNNILGISFILQGISMFSIGSFKIAAILLVGLFFYDVFWVFGTPVMVTVAKKLDGPIKLLFPRSLERNEDGKLELSLLGLGDIVIPGFLVSFMLRFDAVRARVPTAYNPMNSSFPKPYFTRFCSRTLLGWRLRLL